MKTWIKVVLGTAVVFVGLALFVLSSFSSTFNGCVAQENLIKAQYGQNQNNYDNYFKKLRESVQVNDMYAEDLKKIYAGALSGRYGKNGSKAVFQFIQEHNPNVDSSVYTKVQQIIESGRNSFEADQKMLLDKKRVYETYVQSFPNNLVVGMLGFPKIDLAKYDIVTSEETQEAFTTKKAAPIKLR